MASGDLILYSTDDGLAQFTLREMDGQVWLTQLEMAELFDATKQNISLHLKNVFQDGELDPAATVKESLTVQTEDARQANTQDDAELKALENTLKKRSKT